MKRSTISSSVRLPVRAKAQDESHTCGACALFGLTRWHGLDLSFQDVRDMLGTDHSLLLFPGRAKLESLLQGPLEDWKGTLPMDIFYTLWALGFTSRNLPLREQGLRKAVSAQLEKECPVIALIQTIYGPHWVLISGISRTGISFTDSLQPWRKVFWRQERVNRDLLGAVAAIPGEDLLVPAMSRAVPFHVNLVRRYSQWGWRFLNGRGLAA